MTMPRAASLVLALAALCSPVAAQDCVGATRLLLGLAPGGVTDALARTIAQGLAARTGRAFIVDNKAGAGGNIATTLVANAPADGCTLLVTGNWHHINLLVYAKPGYEFKDFAPVANVAEATTILAANAEQPFKTLAALVFSDQLATYGFVPKGGSVIAFDVFLKEHFRVTHSVVTGLKLKAE